MGLFVFGRAVTEAPPDLREPGEELSHSVAINVFISTRLCVNSFCI